MINTGKIGIVRHNLLQFSIMSPFRLLLQKCGRAACCAIVALLFASSALAQENALVQAEFQSADSRVVTRGDIRHLENTVRSELREIHETIRWLLIALLAIWGLPQLSAWRDRNRKGGNGHGNWGRAAENWRENGKIRL